MVLHNAAADNPEAERQGHLFAISLNLGGCVMLSFLGEFMRFLWARKKYWLIPVMAIMLTFGGLLVLSQGSVIAPFIYTLF